MQTGPQSAVDDEFLLGRVDLHLVLIVVEFSRYHPLNSLRLLLIDVLHWPICFGLHQQKRVHFRTQAVDL